MDEHGGGTVASPNGPGLPQGGGPVTTPGHISSLTPRPRSGVRRYPPCAPQDSRTPLGIRGRYNSGFKSPVQSPSVSNSSTDHDDNLQREISDLTHKEAALDKEIEQLEAEGYGIEELDKHISLLHEYNELKDTGQMLLGRVAVLRGVTTRDLYAEFGLDLDD